MKNNKSGIPMFTPNQSKYNPETVTNNTFKLLLEKLTRKNQGIVTNFLNNKRALQRFYNLLKILNVKLKLDNPINENDFIKLYNSFIEIYNKYFEKIIEGIRVNYIDRKLFKDVLFNFKIKARQLLLSKQNNSSKTNNINNKRLIELEQNKSIAELSNTEINELKKLRGNLIQKVMGKIESNMNKI
jgi:hypothetical protein